MNSALIGMIFLTNKRSLPFVLFEKQLKYLKEAITNVGGILNKNA